MRLCWVPLQLDCCDDGAGSQRSLPGLTSDSPELLSLGSQFSFMSRHAKASHSMATDAWRKKTEPPVPSAVPGVRCLRISLPHDYSYLRTAQFQTRRMGWGHLDVEVVFMPGRKQLAEGVLGTHPPHFPKPHFCKVFPLELCVFSTKQIPPPPGTSAFAPVLTREFILRK